ncbi:hypothetical protein HH303_06940 [Rhodospirillaceae bacterium KN72]|uniref:Uncharacterized protein n=1 Tax=Pacificispira spongiicola TaxID=2729598 RepID=A0A7Y0E0G7_9PROT|nr:hypothetical protein [Pacificispira spongiicola]NMM44206.1 hypothetical protein [Pacificispira spongiicola]
MKLTETYRKLVKDTTINNITLLSTDYLNHFNELVMMLEMVADMPDMLEEAEAWTPLTYHEHFQNSSFQHKDLACFAYESAPDEYRVPLDDCVDRMDAEIAEGLPRLRALADAGDTHVLSVEARNLSMSLRGRIDMMSALINGAMNEEQYKASLDAAAPAEHGTTVMDQSEIDSLFD